MRAASKNWQKYSKYGPPQLLDALMCLKSGFYLGQAIIENLWMSNDKTSANLGLVNPSESLLKEVSYLKMLRLK